MTSENFPHQSFHTISLHRIANFFGDRDADPAALIRSLLALAGKNEKAFRVELGSPALNRQKLRPFSQSLRTGERLATSWQLRPSSDDGPCDGGVGVSDDHRGS